MPKVSVIVPCLNMRKHIEDCLESIVSQTLRELEILVVDVGLTDGLSRMYFRKVEEKIYGSF